MVELIAGPMRLGENVKSALARVARATGLGDRRVRSIWNGEARRIDATEMDRLRQVALDARTQQEARLAYHAYVARLQRAREAFRLPGQDMDLDADHGRLGLAGGTDLALDRGAAA
ncbi:hypothetical protein [Methylobacterium sp. J-090]|uniref:hypothetical protein n=1 Tax=Methylobacterium sp. J-090 TaxID=2836666 RepID=UPI001FB9FD30|nr:hypothetical protein [Methylobacterium sp. J-090]MCJ2080728.1 hypothetical protein [Methylobacterium sp. J-090]